MSWKNANTAQRIHILGGRVIDPAQQLDLRTEVLVAQGRIAAFYQAGDRRYKPGRSDRILDAEGCLVLPGLIDLHVHLRQPGMPEAETIESGTRAAAAGGFTTLVCMPNTQPVMDRPSHLRNLCNLIQKHARVRVLPTAAVSLNLDGRTICDVSALAKTGICAFSDDGVGTHLARVLSAALRQSAAHDLVVLTHCEDHRLSGSGAMRSGRAAKRLGLGEIPAQAESVVVKRNLELLARCGGRLHLQHVSTVASLQLVRRAKKAGLLVSCEVTPHHLFLTTDDVEHSAGPTGPDPNLKMNPPLGTSLDLKALRRGLTDGSVDAVASDHAPHPEERKKLGFARAPFGVIGLETTLPLLLHLVRIKVLPLAKAVQLMTQGPARVLKLDSGSLRIHAPADITVVDPGQQWRVEGNHLQSKSKNTPFLHQHMRGKARWTLVSGQVVHGPSGFEA